MDVTSSRYSFTCNCIDRPLETAMMCFIVHLWCERCLLLVLRRSRSGLSALLHLLTHEGVRGARTLEVLCAALVLLLLEADVQRDLGLVAHAKELGRRVLFVALVQRLNDLPATGSIQSVQSSQQHRHAKQAGVRSVGPHQLGYTETYVLAVRVRALERRMHDALVSFCELHRRTRRPSWLRCAACLTLSMDPTVICNFHNLTNTPCFGLKHGEGCTKVTHDSTAWFQVRHQFPNQVKAMDQANLTTQQKNELLMRVRWPSSALSSCLGREGMNIGGG